MFTIFSKNKIGDQNIIKAKEELEKYNIELKQFNLEKEIALAHFIFAYLNNFLSGFVKLGFF